ncbi:MAG: C_GCAxxG_C_C family protein [Acholeplasmataceae bacterium]|jgi:C_GCAxxG_C_C family probable redox protein|nr:C_GCAxxG_C_C family protein [Acholeplasmataceae bacterium]
MNLKIKERVHELYWKHDINCARTMLICLCELFDIDIEKQTLNSAIGLHGAGGFRAQCGLVEGALMFIGIYFSDKGKTEANIASICYQYAYEFTQRFGSLKCYDLRPNGFSENDPPHACEEITGVAIEFTKEFIKKV